MPYIHNEWEPIVGESTIFDEHMHSLEQMEYDRECEAEASWDWDGDFGELEPITYTSAF